MQSDAARGVKVESLPADLYGAVGRERALDAEDRFVCDRLGLTCAGVYRESTSMFERVSSSLCCGGGRGSSGQDTLLDACWLQTAAFRIFLGAKGTVNHSKQPPGIIIRIAAVPKRKLTVHGHAGT